MALIYNLYSTDGCHLCEQALALIAQVNPNIKINVLDIMDDPVWLESFQIRIPVLEIPNTSIQLDWPFDAEQLSQFLSTND
ncbi:glutaredoxin family protein [Marinicellulosiphila megalodicopiae]|uniref:glutaredoxin family protein n=1 Tax=Marinicellulosiphila megalodicopiae TaxID=2724896 RepID=UPI003BB1DC72